MEILKRYRVVITIILLLIASFFIYLFVFASDDIYENQIETKNIRVNIIDGTANVDGNFDSNDEAGNDSSASNKIVRNFDQITYEISYDLGYKESTTIPQEEQSLDVNRNVIIDLIVKDDLYLEVSETDYMNLLTEDFVINNNSEIYKYYKIEVNDSKMIESNKIDIIFSKINGKNNQVISPIIRVREKTDNTYTEITDNTLVSEVNKITVDDVRVSAKQLYGIHLYQGVIKNTNYIDSTLPVGVLVYLPFDNNKGIKGIEVVDSLSFNLNINSSVTSSDSTIVNDFTINNYTESSEYVVNNLPYSYTNNGNSSINVNYINDSGNTNIRVNFEGLSFNSETRLKDISEGENVYYLSSKVLVFNAKRSQNYESDVIYNITTDVQVSNSINDYLDNYKEFVGDYTTKIDFFNRNISYDNELILNTPGKAIYNYNEEFYIQNTINYGLEKGNDIQSGYTNYIKIDNDVITLIDIGNTSDQTKDYYAEFSNSKTDYNINTSYGLGEWDLSHFTIKENAPSYCPNQNELSSMSESELKDKLMNMYGGPCIKETNVEWVNSIQDAIDNNKQNKIIMFKFDMLDRYEKGVQTTIRLKAKVLNNPSNIGKTTPVISRGKTIFNGVEYYLSDIPKISVESQADDIKYEKTTYSSDYEKVLQNHKTYINNQEVSNSIGNTILVSPFKASFNPITTYDKYNSQKTTFYSGMTDPIEFIFNPIIYKSDFDATIQNATISVYLPDNLELYLKSGDKEYNAQTSGSKVTLSDGITYKVYNYDYTESDINFENESVSGTIPNLRIHAYISISTEDRTSSNVKAVINGVLKNNMTGLTYSATSTLEDRMIDVDLTLRNTKDINTIGKTDVIRIDKSSSYIYNMRSANNSQSTTDLSLLYILPYSGDGVGSGSKFSGTVGVSIEGALKEGYQAYYTSDNSKTILTKELDDNSNNNWTLWTNYNEQKEGITAIKLVKNSTVDQGRYLGKVSGTNLKIYTKNNKENDKYYNNFYIIQKNASVCMDEDSLMDECNNIQTKTVSYASNISEVTVYNRSISGYVFEDENYDGFYEENESRLKDIIVDLYKLNTSDFDSKNPVEYISDNDTLISDGKGLTDKKGYYKFDSLQSGNYYVKYTFDCEKYTVTDKNKTDITMQGDASLRDSDAQMISGQSENNTCYAISNIITLNNSVVDAKNIDLGLSARQDFDISIKKYITNVKVISNGVLIQDNNYNNQSKVKVDVRNLKNTSFIVTYGIEIENTKYFPGTIGNIIETIPDGMTFNKDRIENDGWIESDGNLYYEYLNKALIMPKEKYHLKIVLELQTDSGGDYINFVAAKDLKIKSVITNFTQLNEEEELNNE